MNSAQISSIMSLRLFLFVEGGENKTNTQKRAFYDVP